MTNSKLIKDNSGLSLIEIIIVLAILAIIGSATLLATSVATDKHVTACAEKISSSLESTRSIVLGKQSGYVEIWKGSDDFVYCQMHIDGKLYGNEVSIGHAGLTVTYTLKDGTVGTLDSSHQSIEFYRSNGCVKGTNPITEFEVTNGRRTIKVKIDTFTGRVSTERVN